MFSSKKDRRLYFIFPYATYAKRDEDKFNVGCMNKVPIQIKNMEKAGLDVVLCKHPISTVSIPRFIKSNIHYYQKLSNIIKYSSASDIIFIRQLFPYIMNFLSVRRRHESIIVFETHEIGKDMHLGKNYPLVKNLQLAYIRIMDKFLLGTLLKKVDGVVAVTNEIKEYNMTRGPKTIGYLTLGNGTDVSIYPIRKGHTFDVELHVLCVAMVSAWHGVDRFIQGLHEYNAHYANSTKIVLHIVGDGPELPHLKDLTNNLGLNECVIFHGFKSGKELDEMFDMCHIALDALAGFRKGLTELSSLKSREYCARGIPFLMASKDADFPDGFNWIQMVPAEEQPIDMNTVVDFANRMMTDPEHPQKMRRYAEEHLDWMAKMKVLKEFLESL